MGQCLPVESSEMKFHPLLGNVESLVLNGSCFIDLKIGISSQQQYMQFSKSINKLKYNNQINKIIYLPIREYFNDSQGFCETNHEVTLRFNTYHQTLLNNINKNISFNNHYRQAQIWHLLYTLTKYVKHFDRHIQNSTNLTYNHIIIDSDGRIKVIPEIILPSCRKSLQIYQYISQNKYNIHNSISIIAIIALSLTNLIYPNIFYDESQRQWKTISQQKKEKYFSYCRERYSQQLVNILKQMIEINKQRVGFQQLARRLEVFSAQMQMHLQVPKNRYFGDSRQETRRENYIGDINSIKNSNIFISQGTNRLWQSEVNFEQYKHQDKFIHSIQYPSIL